MQAGLARQGSRPVYAVKPHLLIVDDDPLIAESLSYFLGREFQVRTASNRREALDALRTPPTPALALVDLGLPPQPHTPSEGFELIANILALAPDTRIVVLSGQNDGANGRHARTLGATEFIGKPAAPDHLLQVLQRVGRFREGVSAPGDGLIGDSAAILRLKTQVRQFADAPFPVLVEGESGTGKELVANALHRLGSRREAPFLALNCAAISPSLVEATLFGHAKGAFTGAAGARSGYFEDAGSGTLFLDEIGDMPLELQPKLLRVLENGQFQRIGETQDRHASARIIAATNRNLQEEVKAGRFRGDLYHRLSVLSLTMPPLRDRDMDCMLLLRHFLAQYATQAAAPVPTLNPDAEQMLRRYAFPGNVRELRNIAIRLCAKHPGSHLSVEQLVEELDQPASPQAPAPSADPVEELVRHVRTEMSAGRFNLEQTLLAIEAGCIDAAQEMTAGNLSQAAKLLGINRTTLYNRLQVIARSEGRRTG